MIAMDFGISIRPARSKDLKDIQKLLEHYNFHFEVRHMKSMYVAEDKDGVMIGAGIISTLLEATFVTFPNAPQRDRVGAMQSLILQCNTEAERLNYDSYHGFVKEPLVKKTLIKHFGFAPVVGDMLIRWIK